MFFARMSCTTVMSGVVFQVVDGFAGKVLVETRDPGRAVAVAARLNSGG
jgi:hypothetical protein